MDFRILGPLQALDERRDLPLGGGKQRALLALLLVHANETLSTDRLIDELWGEELPAAPAKTLQMHVSRLRRALVSDADEDGDGVVLTREHGYELHVDPDHLDAHRFERLLDHGRDELAAGRPARAAAALEKALALWRGRPLADLHDEPFAQREVARLADLRLTAQELRIEAQLQLGHHVEVVGELEALIAQEPFRERLRGQLMLALYRADRQADALQAYQDARRELVHELGIEPGQRLRDLEAAILAQDPALTLATPEGPRAPRRAQPDRPSPATTAGLPDLPTGVVTFLLTDIEGSTPLWERDAGAMADALELHDELIATTAHSHAGQLLKMKGEGDSTLSVFRRASDAVAAAVTLRRCLRDAVWPGGLNLQLRVALHTGEAHERDGDYFGPTLNRAARLRGVADGGVTVLSQATTEIVQDHLPAGAELVDLGLHQLTGLARPERVFELQVDAPADGEAPAADEATRKVVSVLFATLADTARPTQPLDPEARQRLRARCLTTMRATLERHGGAVEAVPGDALLAVFGIPRLHEDDALRALRAAAELRTVLAALAAELEPVYGVRPATRVGVSTGEILALPAAHDQPLAAGDAVNRARTLEELAAIGEILIDDPTRRVVRERAQTEPGGVRTARSGEEVAALRLLGVTDTAAGRGPRRDTLLVGRDGPLEVLDNVFAAAVRDGTCHLVTVLGVAGVGKSRLVEEFVLRLDDRASVRQGRCLPYGEGITYWPLSEIVHSLTDDDDAPTTAIAAMAACVADDPSAEQIVAGVSEALGLGGAGESTSEKIFWAVRRLMEALARPRPLVLVLDDLHWAEPTFLDLVEHIADLSRSAPIVLLCLARPELLDERAGWGGGKLNATTILLEPLDADDSARLVELLLGGAKLPPGVARQLADAIEGNPLFAEELLAELGEDGLLRADEQRWTGPDALPDLPVPRSIHTLLAARLERLPNDERALLARASVEGVVFHSGAAAALAPPALADRTDQTLVALVRRDVIRPQRASFAGQDAFRFRHALIRDAAYRSVSKALRAELHTRLAGWLEETGADRLVEFEEIVGYHLEQAFRLLGDIGPLDAAAGEVGRRGAQRLEAAGRRALGRSDRAGAINLLGRAAALLPDDARARAELLPEIAVAMIESGRFDDAEAVVTSAGAAAAAVDDPDLAAQVEVQREVLRLQRGDPQAPATAAAAVQRLLPVFTAAGDELGLSRAHGLQAWLHWIAARAEPAAGAWERAAAHARRAGAENERIATLGWIASAQFFGPTRVRDGIVRCEAIQRDVRDEPATVASVQQCRGALTAMQGDVEGARALIAASEAAFAELGLTLSTAVSHHGALVELLAGDPQAAETVLRRGYRTLEEIGERMLLSTTAAFLGQALLAQERYDEAERYTGVAGDLALADDQITQILWRQVRGRTLAARGEFESAQELARAAVAVARRTDFLNHEADALLDLGLVLRQAGEAGDARAALGEALALYERKGNVVGAGRAQAELAPGPRV